MGANVPNYEGMFLRGRGSRTSTHYGSVTHASGALGALQGDAIRNFSGVFMVAGLGWGGAHMASGIFYDAGNWGAQDSSLGHLGQNRRVLLKE